VRPGTIGRKGGEESHGKVEEGRVGGSRRGGERGELGGKKGGEVVRVGETTKGVGRIAARGSGSDVGMPAGSESLGLKRRGRGRGVTDAAMRGGTPAGEASMARGTKRSSRGERVRGRAGGGKATRDRSTIPKNAGALGEPGGPWGRRARMTRQGVGVTRSRV